MGDGPFGMRRPRPLADLPLGALADGEAPAKAWLLALIERAPLAEAGAVPAAELAREAPALCAAMLRALGSDAALERLQPGGDLDQLAARAGRLAGAGGAAGAAGAVGALRAALWEAVHGELRRPDAGLVAALAERLAFVCDVVAQATLSGTQEITVARGGPLRAVPAAEPDPLSGLSDELLSRRGATPWAALVAEHLSRRASGGPSFAVLAVEVDDAERLLAADRDEHAAEALRSAETAVRAELRPVDAALAERLGRLWIVAPELGAGGARALGERLAAAVAGAATLQGAPLRASIGLAVCPDDGTEAEALLAHADEGVFAARAAGEPLA
jgi:GGDEF domain-containing protein